MKLEAKVGTLFIVSICIFGTLVLRMEKLSVFGKRSQAVFITEFNQVAGLNIKSNVRVAGVEVGTVTNIVLSGNKAVVTLGLFKKYPIYKDALASLGSIGILGEKYLSLDPGHPASGLLPEGGSIRSKNIVSLDELTETIGDISKDIKNVTASLNETIGNNHGKQQINGIMDNIYKLTGEFRAIINENHKRINSTVTNLEQLSNDLKYGLPNATNQFSELGKSLNEVVMQSRPELQTALANINKLTASLQSTSDNMLSITSKINKGEGTVGRLINDESTINKIHLTADHLNSMLGSIKNIDLNLDLNAMHWNNRQATMGSLGIDIVPSRNHWYNLSLNNTPDGKTSISNTYIDKIAGTVRNTSSKDVTTTNRTFTINAQLAKRVAENIVLTAGVIENSGGGSIEFRTLDDRLRFGLMGYDFNKRVGKRRPRYRITSSYQFYKEGYIQIGIQDIANPELRTFCLGGGLRWKDEDLKKLIGITSLKM